MIPDHKCYCEVFGGGASLLFAKPSSKVEVYNDIDGDVVSFFRLFHDPVAMKEFKRKCHYTPYSRETFFEYSWTWEEQTDPIEKIYRWFIVSLMQFSGRRQRKGGCSFGASGSKVSHMKSTIDNMDAYVDRLRGVQIDNRSWEYIIPLYDSSDTFFYLDPPYLHDTRTEKRSYPHEMTDSDHSRLIDLLSTIEGKVLLSGYPNDLYNRLAWSREDIECYAYSGMRKGYDIEQLKRTECLWHNYEIQPTLF